MSNAEKRGCLLSFNNYKRAIDKSSSNVAPVSVKSAWPHITTDVKFGKQRPLWSIPYSKKTQQILHTSMGARQNWRMTPYHQAKHLSGFHKSTSLAVMLKCVSCQVLIVLSRQLRVTWTWNHVVEGWFDWDTRCSKWIPLPWVYSVLWHLKNGVTASLQITQRDYSKGKTQKKTAIKITRLET